MQPDSKGTISRLNILPGFSNLFISVLCGDSSDHPTAAAGWRGGLGGRPGLFLLPGNIPLRKGIWV